ncbi:uncharacterized protein P884DRAFT_261683 [Thermothelomyces heterothallicus CBS 202.75]|uniref:uncharacterized protein n=1 Tax=Thermothelomyces heterothallicus CBS 202.75 TaxID=1149848 RepID=UPI00374373A8
MPGVLTRNTPVPRGHSDSSTPATGTTKCNKLSKAQAAGKQSQTSAPFTPRSSNIEIVLPSRKRKVQDAAECTSKKIRFEPETSIAPATPVSRKRKGARFAEPDAAAAPSTPNCAAPTPSSSRKRRFESDETSQAEELLERLNLQSSPVSKRSKTTVHRRAPQNDFDLPNELLDLLDLHAAFLKTLNMQYAHNDTTSPIDLRTLYTSVTRAWGKRHVMLDDIQRCVGVLSWTPTKTMGAQPTAPFYLTDYGRDKICIEFHPSAEPGPLREPKLKMDFEANLRTLWLSRSNNIPPTIFIGTLPKAPLHPKNASMNPLLAASAKTQTTLDAFKQSIAEKKQQDEAAKKQAAAAAAANGPSGGSLLDRIRLKETLASQSPQNEPTAADLQRRRALQRAADVAAVIGMLCKATVATGSGQARVSFSMAALMVRLKDSVRTPVSQEDGMLCVRLLAAEVAPHWLKIVKIGGRENVVCTMGMQPTKAEVEDRVKALLG